MYVCIQMEKRRRPRTEPWSSPIERAWETGRICKGERGGATEVEGKPGSLKSSEERMLKRRECVRCLLVEVSS